MEGAKPCVYASETTVRCKPSPACPTPHSTMCYPSSVPSPRPPSHTRMQPGAQPVQDGVPLAVAPKANCQPGRSNDRLSSLLTRRLLPLLCSGSSVRWRARKPRNTGLSSRRCSPLLWCLLHCCPRESWRPRRRCQRRCTVWIASALMPPTVPSIVRQRLRHSASIPVGKQPAYAAAYGHVAPYQADRLAGADVERAPSRCHHGDTSGALRVGRVDSDQCSGRWRLSWYAICLQGCSDGHPDQEAAQEYKEPQPAIERGATGGPYSLESRPYLGDVLI